MPILSLPATPFRPGVSPVSVGYREWGRGRPLLLLHGGWGYAMYPFDRQAAALADRFHLIAPDRSGYGVSGPVEALGPRFHHAAAAETLAVLDALGWRDVAVWGHSDGAVIAVLMALAQPGRVDRLVLEALHLYRHKPASRSFFAGLAADPGGLDARVAGVLAAEHGAGYWATLIHLHAQAWLDLDDERPEPGADLYDGRLSDLHLPTLVLHGRQDPRTEPGELDAVRRALPHAVFAVLADGGHSPHSERAVADEATRVAAAFLDGSMESTGERA
jgi:pimeloyl-ACP methyl ester carboxylesterase